MQRIQVSGIDNFRALRLHGGNGLFHKSVHVGMVAKEVSGDADARPLQAIFVEEGGVIGGGGMGGNGRFWVAWVWAGDRAEQNGRVGNSAGHRPGRILAVGDGNNA